MENRCVSLWEMKQFNLFVCITFGNLEYLIYENRHVWILKYIAARLHMHSLSFPGTFKFFSDFVSA